MGTFRRHITMVTIATILAILAAEPGVSRSVNISSSWLLPQNEFPVFYRHFRDRVTWFEADAVCQFHHAQLATVESNSQFEAIRSYLKELDVTENVWIGLKRNSEASEFTWTNYQPLARSGYFREDVPRSLDPVCVVTDPTANFKWHSLHCGGPEVASFVCELPVPYWASKSNGCMTSMMEGMTVTFLPERPAIQLTKECSPGVSKNVTCKGNMKQSEIMEQLSCPNSNKLLKTLIKPIRSTLTDVKLRTTTSSSEADVEDYAIEMATIAQYNDETIQSISKVMGRGADGMVNLPQEMSIAQEPIKSGRGLFDTNGIDSAFIGGAAEISVSTSTPATTTTTISTTSTTSTTSIPSTTASRTTTDRTTTSRITTDRTTTGRTTTGRTTTGRTTTDGISTTTSTTTITPPTTNAVPTVSTVTTATSTEPKRTTSHADAADVVTAANRPSPRTVADNVTTTSSTSATTTDTGKLTAVHAATDNLPTTSSSTVFRVSTSTGRPIATIALNIPNATATASVITSTSSARSSSSSGSGTTTTTVSSGGHHHHHHHHSSTTARSPIIARIPTTANVPTTEKALRNTTARIPTTTATRRPVTSFTVNIPYTVATTQVPTAAEPTTAEATTRVLQAIRVYKKIELPPTATDSSSDRDDFPYMPANYTGTSTVAATGSPMNSTTAAATGTVKTGTTRPAVTATTTTTTTAAPATTSALEPATPNNDTFTTAAGTSGALDDTNWNPTPSSPPPADTAAVATDTTAAITSSPPTTVPPTATPMYASSTTTAAAATATAAAATATTTTSTTTTTIANHRKASSYDAYTEHPNRSRHIIRPKQHHHSYPYILYRLLG